MKKNIIKIGAVFTIAAVMVFLGFKAQRAFGQALQQPANQITSVTYTGGSAVLTNVQLATITFGPALGTIPNGGAVWFPTGLQVNNSNDFVYVSNPFGTFAGTSNGVYTAGKISNNVVWAGILVGTNVPAAGLVLTTNFTLRVKTESFQ